MIASEWAELSPAALDTPAYIRRAMLVDEMQSQFRQRCVQEHRRQLDRLKTPLRKWRLAESTGRFAVPPAARDCLQVWAEHVFLPEDEQLPRFDPGIGRSWLTDLRDAGQRCNDRWRRCVAELDYQPINQLIDGYNRYYLLEKECALRSVRLARLGFTPKRSLDAAWVFEQCPLLPLW